MIVSLVLETWGHDNDRIMIDNDDAEYHNDMPRLKMCSIVAKWIHRPFTSS